VHFSSASPGSFFVKGFGVRVSKRFSPPPSNEIALACLAWLDYHLLGQAWLMMLSFQSCFAEAQ
jgi:hypothetical protein